MEQPTPSLHSLNHSLHNPYPYLSLISINWVLLDNWLKLNKNTFCELFPLIQALCYVFLLIHDLCDSFLLIQAYCDIFLLIQALCEIFPLIQVLCDIFLLIQALCDVFLLIQALCDIFLLIQALCCCYGLLNFRQRKLYKNIRHIKYTIIFSAWHDLHSFGIIPCTLLRDFPVTVNISFLCEYKHIT